MHGTNMKKKKSIKNSNFNLHNNNNKFLQHAFLTATPINRKPNVG